AWLQAVRRAAGSEPALALELVECGRLVKGYGDTRARTTAQMQAIVAHAATGTASAASIAALRDAALADDEGRAFALALNA
ncbi:MAG: indolepyruvate ferredoxin oxidoreductase, partial [Haliea sp.]|nr:indolepyruvate ferredoxin oxidoreductase [Haliea sp.]